MRDTPTNRDDVIDSRDVIARIEELEEHQTNAREYPDTCEPFTDDDAEELKALQALVEEAAGCADWQHGETLIRDDYFKTYARDFADDIGATDKELSWPHNCIDWEQAARELQMDYTSVDFDGVTYWVRS